MVGGGVVADDGDGDREIYVVDATSEIIWFASLGLEGAASSAGVDIASWSLVRVRLGRASGEEGKGQDGNCGVIHSG